MDLEERGWDLAVFAAAGLAGVLARRALIVAWKATTGDEPPQNPAAPHVSWSAALAWTAAIGLAVGAGRLVGRRAAAEGWRARFGRYPAALREQAGG